jgi:hypothetical protein
VCGGQARAAWKCGPLDRGEGGGTRKWGDNKGGRGCDDDKGGNKGREEETKRGKMRRGGGDEGGEAKRKGWLECWNGG